MSPSQTAPNASHYDYLLVGGGLQNALLFLALRHYQPTASVALFEATDSVGGNHTWSFHGRDVPDSGRAIVKPLVGARWPGYRVEFPRLSRRIDTGYASISSEGLRGAVEAAFEEAPGCRLFLGTRLREIGPQMVRLPDGRTMSGGLVVDARGPSQSPQRRRDAERYQKFYGMELELGRDAHLSEPILMDARVRQTDGFRFMYVLPFSRRRVLVEDTYYSDTPDLNVDVLRDRVLRYAALSRFDVARTLREEHGALPLPLREAAVEKVEAPLRAGYAGGWFHPTTGYSLPVALRLALFVAQQKPEAVFGTDLASLAREVRRQQRYCLLLNRLLFGAFASDQRRNVLERFYQMPEATIERFYALQTTPMDRARILCGRPPRGISLKRALASTFETSLPKPSFSGAPE